MLAPGRWEALAHAPGHGQSPSPPTRCATLPAAPPSRSGRPWRPCPTPSTTSRAASSAASSPSARRRNRRPPAYTWCALDTLIFPGVLGVTAHVESPCQTTGILVRLTVAPACATVARPGM
ncbi:organomercurial lyase [Streptomyces sp. NBC_00637]|uniref:organomercurial lyase n=1 Tax=Streptomyces sp. NBC_00637 TaxID=2903667 RepID=UPI0038695939